MEVTTAVFGDTLKIYINGLLHLCFRDRITSVHAWKEERSWWKIQVCMGSNKELAEYDAKEKWETILKVLDNHI